MTKSDKLKVRIQYVLAFHKNVGNVEICVSGRLIEAAGPGMIIGEMALIDSCDRSATVVAKDNCVLAQLNESEFLSLMEKTPHFGLSVMKILVTRLRNTDSII